MLGFPDFLIETAKLSCRISKDVAMQWCIHPSRAGGNSFPRAPRFARPSAPMAIARGFRIFSQTLWRPLGPSPLSSSCQAFDRTTVRIARSG